MLDKLLTFLGIHGHKWPQSKRGTYITDNYDWETGERHLCSIQNCQRVVYAKTYCNAHYQRALRVKHLPRKEYNFWMSAPIRQKRKKKSGEKGEMNG